MAHEDCGWPACAKAAKCYVCGKKLCSPETHRTRRIEGHFITIDDKVECMECHDKKRLGK